jgi:hypothetical protein
MMDLTTAVLTIGANPATGNKSIIRERLNGQIHLLYTRKVYRLRFFGRIEILIRVFLHGRISMSA